MRGGTPLPRPHVHPCSLLPLGLFMALAVGCASESGEPFAPVLLDGRVIDPPSGLDGVRSVGIRDGGLQEEARPGRAIRREAGL